jgi:hypothetical protein
MAWYNTGTIALTNGSATVTGSGTNFLVGAQIGEALYAPDGKLYEIQTIDSATVITLASNYLGSTASAQGYQIIPTQSLVADLASDVTDLISDFADVRDYAGNGKFNDGAVGTPGITFTQDQDNGLYRIGSNNWALAAGGQKIVDISTSGIGVTGTVTASGEITANGGIALGDNDQATFGDGDDLQIYSDGTNGILKNTNGNYILLDTDNLAIRSQAGSNRIIVNSTGIDVTGTVTASTSFATGVGIIKDIDSNSVMIGSGAVNLRMIDVTGDIRPVTANGLGVDATIDLGDAGARFKDLYLSGGVVFGDAGGSGTPASNTFDSYEEGTFTPALHFGTGSSSGATYGNAAGTYTKIGNRVTYSLYLLMTDKGTSTGQFKVGGFPFNADSAGGGAYNVACPAIMNQISHTGQISCYQDAGTVNFYSTATTGVRATMNETNVADTSEIMLSGTYMTA